MDRKLRACIFDLDGVIVDTAKYHYLAWKRLADGWGFDFTKEHNEKLKGVSRVRSLEILLEIGGLSLGEKAKEDAARLKNEWYVEYIDAMDQREILPGVHRFLEELDQARVPFSLGSASKNAMRILRRIGLHERFAAVIDGTKVEKAKPDPEVFLLAAAELGVEAENCVVFEDAEAGVEAANRAGMASVGIGDPRVLGSADLVIPGLESTHWSDIVAFFCSQTSNDT